MNALAPVASAILIIGCGALSPPHSPADSGAADAAVTTKHDGDAGQTGSATDAGMSRADAGLKPNDLLQFTTLPLSPDVDSTELVGLSGSPGGVWAIQTSGQVLHFEGTRFEVPFSVSTSQSGKAVYASGQAVFLAAP